MAKDWTKIYQQYKGLWVAFQDDEETVVASGRSAKEALEEAKKTGHTDPILARMPEKLVGFVSSLQI